MINAAAFNVLTTILSDRATTPSKGERMAAAVKAWVGSYAGNDRALAGALQKVIDMGSRATMLNGASMDVLSKWQREMEAVRLDAVARVRNFAATSAALAKNNAAAGGINTGAPVRETKR